MSSDPVVTCSPDQIRVELLAYPNERLYESCTEFCSEQACDLERRAERENLGWFKVFQCEPYDRCQHQRLTDRLDELRGAGSCRLPSPG